MRRRVESGGVVVQAVSGNNAVFLGLDLAAELRPGCLGFSLYRVDHTEDEHYWLAGFKTFRSLVPAPDPNTVYSTRHHPLQTFYWGDYSAKPGHRYSYRVVPRYGTPASLTDQPGVEATVEVETSDPRLGSHGVYFNRGVAASQAYAHKFGLPPDQLPPEKRAEALVWLSRGLLEAILAFVAQADSNRFALRAAVYEFTQPDVLAAFRAAHEQGADVQIVYHALDDSEGNANRAAIAAAGLGPELLIERTNATIAHNKFVVLCSKDDNGALTPMSVWTGSTNLSEGGIFGHSNVGHEVRIPEIAADYLGYWNELARDPELDPLRDWVTTSSPFDPAAATAGTRTIFSPRHGLAPLRWYASELGNATSLGQITEAFGVGKLFEQALEQNPGDGLRYVMLDKRDDNQAVWSASHKVFVAVGSSGGPSVLTRWAKETLTGFNSFVPYLHTKILLVNPLSGAPLTITGSANFSPASTNENDENMLVIPDELEVADVYFTEYARIFNHLYARFWASELNTDPADADTHSFLDETDGWQTPYFTAGGQKQPQRTLYSSAVEANS